MAQRGWLRNLIKPKGIDELISKFPNNVSKYGYDAWGFNIKGIEATIGIGKFLYEKYFRVEVHGLEHIPPEGRVLIISNHSGQIPIDGFLLAYSLLTNPHAPRTTKAMMERFVPTVPFVNILFSQIGGVVGDPTNCKRMLEAEEAIIVFPEGSRGISKPFKKRYQLQRFGTGFMHLAMRNNTPIIPVGIVGCEESIINLNNMESIAKVLSMPSAPLVIPFVFPTKVVINIGKPINFSGDVTREDIVREKVEVVKDEIEVLLKKGRSQRKGIFGF